MTEILSLLLLVSVVALVEGLRLRHAEQQLVIANSVTAALKQANEEKDRARDVVIAELAAAKRQAEQWYRLARLPHEVVVIDVDEFLNEPEYQKATVN